MNLSGPRIQFTVVTKSGARYDAVNLTPVQRDGDLQPQLAFVCSGRMMVVDADQIEAVTAWIPRAGDPAIQRAHCGHCDGLTPYSLGSVVLGCP